MPEIYINYGTNHPEMTMELMARADVASRLKSDMSVVIKPNLVVARPADGGATTHPGIVEGIIRYLQDTGVKDITIAEGAWVGESTSRVWKACGYEDLRKKYGVKLLDTKTDKTVKVKSAGIDLIVCRSVLEADFLINVPVLKGHCQTDITCCLKNLKGCIPDGEKRRYHTMGLHKPIAALAGALRPHLHVVDSICGDLSFEEGGNPIDSGRIMLGFDPVLLDSYGAALIGYHPDEIGHLRLAREQGAGRYADDTSEIIELNAEKRPKTVMSRSNRARGLARYIGEDGACSACYAALIYALDKLPAPSEKIRIGQGYYGKPFDGIGIGVCASGCERHVPGCPPKAVDVLEFLRSVR